MLQIRCKNTGVTKSFQEGTSLLDVYQEFADEIKLPYPVVSAKVNNVSQGLKFRLVPEPRRGVSRCPRGVGPPRLRALAVLRALQGHTGRLPRLETLHRALALPRLLLQLQEAHARAADRRGRQAHKPAHAGNHSPGHALPPHGGHQRRDRARVHRTGIRRQGEACWRPADRYTATTTRWATPSTTTTGRWCRRQAI